MSAERYVGTVNSTDVSDWCCHVCIDHDHKSPSTENQDRRLTVKVEVSKDVNETWTARRDVSVKILPIAA